jgi:hypothetical protein
VTRRTSQAVTITSCWHLGILERSLQEVHIIETTGNTHMCDVVPGEHCVLLHCESSTAITATAAVATAAATNAHSQQCCTQTAAHRQQLSTARGCLHAAFALSSSHSADTAASLHHCFQHTSRIVVQLRIWSQKARTVGRCYAFASPVTAAVAAQRVYTALAECKKLRSTAVTACGEAVTALLAQSSACS